MSESYTIGYSSLCQSMPSVAYRSSTLQEAAAAHPEIRLMMLDNDLDDTKALANATLFATEPVDVAIIFHINERLGTEINRLLIPKRIPVIAIDIPIPMAVYFGGNNRESGRLAGEAQGAWIRAHWDGQVDKLLVLTEARVVSALRDRVDYSVRGLNATLPQPVPRDSTLYLDGGSSRAMAAERTREVLQRWDGFRHIALVATNDDSALGALDAARELGIEERVAIVGHGADEQARAEIARAGSGFVASADYHFEQYGPRLVELALHILHGERVPRENFIQHTVVGQLTP
jgi:ribose transport system substrate-binding protein